MSEKFYNKTYTELLLEKENHNLWLTLNNPKTSNAISIEMVDELVSVLAQADMDSDIRCIILTGAGKHFCAGGNVKDMVEQKGMFAGDSNELRERYKYGIQKIPMAFNQLSTPIIAMINGAAIGAGLDMACMCDIRIGSEHAKVGETFTKIGLIPGDGGTYFLQRIVGFGKAMEMTLTADIYSADQALKMGLLAKVVPSSKLKSTVAELATKINSNAPIAIQMAKRAITHAYRSDLYSNLELLASYQGITQRTSDHYLALEGVKENVSNEFKHK